MALYNNPYQYSFGVPGQMNQFQQQPVQMPAQPVQQGYILELENELIDTDQLQTVANIIGEQIAGARFRNLEGDLVYNPLVEFGDMVYTYDRLGNKYLTPLTDVSGNVGGLTTVKTQADDPIRGSSDFYGNSTKTIVAARQMVQKENPQEKRLYRD
ncbi:hypothetical protein [Ruminococcus sp. SR1/5]|uniref:hypothetical protein n=1 Tax=Ruminococcus sp. SR1/5 TaxID=657323 RepID=UPI0001CD4A38|nr:hypothetical protein [Ruminococcus sp. SR1/5]CBL18550.1 hypothetical protein CK1_01840 [Ruminococcus sp. SR1/5]